jgi:mannose-6-phosphate isomerase-like protein (cupin superfamily)
MIKIFNPVINDNAVDHRGAIYSYVPLDSIREICYITTRAGVERGHHYHKEFDEYIMLVEGEGIYNCPAQNEKIVVGPGQMIYIPIGCPHTFIPVTDCKSVSLLTKPWNECREPITRYPE